MKFKKKQEIVDAWEWDESKSTFNKIGCLALSHSGHIDNPDLMGSLRISVKYDELTGKNIGFDVSRGDYIIKYPDGSFGVYSKNSFFELYEKLQ